MQLYYIMTKYPAFHVPNINTVSYYKSTDI